MSTVEDKQYVHSKGHPMLHFSVHLNAKRICSMNVYTPELYGLASKYIQNNCEIAIYAFKKADGS